MEKMVPPKRRWPAEIFTSDLHFKGKLEPFGQLLDTLNDVRRDCMVVTDVIITPLDADNPLDSFAMQELTLSVARISFISLLNEEDRRAIALLPNKQYIIAYMPRFVLRAEFRLGGDMRPRDMLDTFSNNFLAVGNATIYPLFAPKIAFSLEFPLLLINKRHILSYHIDYAEPEAAQKAGLGA
jgi:hypothetical protein